MDERGRIATLARVLGRAGAGEGSSDEGIEEGIGDDAAVLAVRPRGGSRLVWTIDEQVEGTHFRRELLAWHDVGWRSYMAATSDVAAMGATPWCALAALSLPDDVGDDALEAIAAGQRSAADVCRAPVVGGNLARGGVLSIATTVLGTCSRPILRRGAEPGDSIWLAGDVGLAGLGFRALECGRGAEAVFEHAVRAWRRPRACLDEGVALASFARAAVDVSDGLARDVGHVAEASGVAIVLDAEALVESAPLLRGAAALKLDALDLALYGGEDYAIVASGPDRAPASFRRIGEVREGSGLRLRDRSGERRLEPRGFDHFTAGTRSGA